MNEYMKETNEALLHTYNQFPVVLERGEGAYLYDTEGKKYLDFAAGYAVSSLGYADKELNDALKEQIDKIFHTSNLYYNTACGKAAEDLKRITGMDRIFFTNSGGEAVEGTLKAARKYAYKKGTGRYEFIAMKESFHGRSFGAVSVKGHDAYREPFEPLVPGVSFAQYNDLDSVKALVTDKTCAIILEPLQGEGGFIPAPIEFVKKLRKICDDNGIMLIADEVQCGNCRTGKYFTSEYWEEAGAAPDIIATAKSMGAGVPISAISAREEVMDAAPAGTIGGTYCGNPLACAAAIKTMEIMKEEDYCAKSIHIGSVVRKAFEKMKEKYDIIGDVRGIGGMLGIEFVKDKERKEPNPEFVSKLVQTALQKGLLLENAGSFGNVIRFLAPLCMTEEQMETGLKIFEESILANL